jgi:hypothetical protein
MLSPDTMMLVTMRQAADDGWFFASSDVSRALCPQHAERHRGDVAPMRVFTKLNQISGVHGLVMVGVEECLDGSHRIAIGASRTPEPAGLVRLTNSLYHQFQGLLSDAASLQWSSRVGGK